MELLLELQLQTAEHEQDKQQMQKNIVPQLEQQQPMQQQQQLEQELEQQQPIQQQQQLELEQQQVKVDDQHNTWNEAGETPTVDTTHLQKHDQQHEQSKVDDFDVAALPPGICGGLRLLFLQLWLQIVSWCAPRTFAKVRTTWIPYRFQARSFVLTC